MLGGDYRVVSLGGLAGAGALAFGTWEHGGSPVTGAVAMAAFLAFALWGWIAAYRRLQALEDIPLSKIATAAQGYTRLEGRAAPFPGQALQAPMTHLPCCWYSYKLESLDQNGEVTSTEQETTDWSFMMTDGSGECVVDPAGAKIATASVNRYRSKEVRWTEYAIFPRDALCVVGQFRTSGMSISEHDIEERVGALVTEWKKDMAGLRARFNLGHELTMQEWERVRQAARQAVEADLARHPPKAQNQISDPRDGRPYLVSTEPRGQLARELKLWALGQAVCFVLGAAILGGWIIKSF
jgi:hypothetical protein